MVIVISNPGSLQDEHAIITQLFDDGLEIFHLRKKSFTEEEIKNFIEEIPEKYFDRIVLHSHFNLVEEYNLKGIHTRPGLGQTELQNTQTRSISFHAIKEVETGNEKFDYAFLSPVFNSISKEGYKSKFDLKELKKFLVNRKEKIIALGGLDEDKIGTVKDLGFSGIGLLGAIWQNENPTEKFKRIKEKWLKKEFAF